MVYRRIAGHFFRYLWLAFAVLVIVYALIVVAGRELLPVISRYQPQINAYLSEKTGMNFEIGALGGLWEGSTPLLDLENIVVVGKDSGTPALTVDRLSAEINLLQTTTNFSPVWQQLSAHQIQINLIENEEGLWLLGGYPLGLGSGETNLDYLFRMLYYSRLLRIDRVVIDMDFYAGSHARLFARDLQVENAEGFHRTTASIALSADGEAIADFVFEGRGDPADVDEFVGQGYLHLQRINLEGSLNTLMSAWFPDLTEQIAAVETDLDFEFWFDWKNKALVNGRGHLSAAELPLLLLPDAPPLVGLRANVTGWYQPGEDWGIRLQQLTASWGEQEVEPVDFQFRQRVGGRWGELDVAVNHVDLDVVSQALLNAHLIGEKGEEVLSSLHPGGSLRHLFLDVNFSGDNPAFKVKANIDDLSLGSWKGAPAARGISGYVESGLHEGFVVLDSPEGFSLHYAQVFKNFMPYGNTRGKVAWEWRPEEKKIYITSNRIKIDGEEGHRRAFLHLELPTAKGGDPQMYLMVGVKNSHTRYVDRYLPKILDEKLTNWLAQAVSDGDIPEAGFVWRGALKKEARAGRSIQVYARLKNGAVDYQQGWPAAEKVTATLVVNNTEMDVHVSDGEIASHPFNDLGVSLRQRASGPLLRVAGELDASVQESLAVLAASPLQEKLAGVTALDAGGAVTIDLDLRIPLSPDKRLEDYRVNARLRDATLNLPGVGYPINGIRGSLDYRRSTGLASRGLKAILWGQPLSVKIATEQERIVIDGDGVLGNEGVRTLLGNYAGFVTGETPVTAELVIPGQGSEEPRVLTLSSALEGMQIELPEPFGKIKEEPLATRLSLEIRDDHLRALGNMEGRLAFTGEIRGGVLSRGGIHLLANTAHMPEQDELLVTGQLPTVDWSDWQTVLTPQVDSAAPESLSPDIKLDLRAENFVVSSFSLGQTHILGTQNRGKGWLLQVESPQAAGDVVVSGQSRPLELALEYLKIPRLQGTVGDGERQEPGTGVLDTLSPLDIPELDVAIQALYYNEKPMGHIAFKSRRQPQGVTVSEIEGSLKGIQVNPQLLSGEGGEVDSAQLQWTVTEAGNYSYFSGTLEIDDVTVVLADWDIPAPYTSESSAFFVNLGWKGKPWQINTLALDGYLGIDFRSGQFYETTGGAAGAFLKLIGLINFDTWLRRLRFDFSDFFSDGLSFDQVEGGLLFREGLVDFEDPVIASMPSGKIRLLGSVDLIYDQLDARLVATMPVGTNLPWVAGLLGGLPAAVGVFLTSKLFEKQVDQLSSIGYKVTGSLDDPKIEVERIFSDPTKLSAPEDKDGDN